MPLMHRLPRTLAAVLAVIAFAAPAAVARPTDSPQGGRAAASERSADLRQPRAEPVYWAYDDPAPVPAGESPYADDGTPWTTIGIAIAGACFLVAGAAALAARQHVRPRGGRVVF